MTEPCSSYRERLHLYLDGEVELIVAREIEIHLAECPQCHSSLEEMRLMERHLRAGLCDFVDCEHPGGFDGLSRTIDRVKSEPKPEWKNVSVDPAVRSRRRYFGWGALLIVGATTTLAVMRLSPIATAPMRVPDGSSAARAPAVPVRAAGGVPDRSLETSSMSGAPLIQGGAGDLDTNAEAFTGARESLEKETDALLAGATGREGTDRARRLRTVGRIWERLARQGNSRHAYQRAIDAFTGAMTIDPRSAREDSSDMRRVRMEAAAPQLR